MYIRHGALNLFAFSFINDVLMLWTFQLAHSLTRTPLKDYSSKKRRFLSQVLFLISPASMMCGNKTADKTEIRTSPVEPIDQDMVSLPFPFPCIPKMVSGVERAQIVKIKTAGRGSY